MSPPRRSAILWRLLGLARPHWRVLAVAFVAMALLGVTTGAYAYLLGPALRYLLTGGADGLGEVARWLPPGWTDRATIAWALPVALVAIGVLKGIGYLGQFYWAGLFGQRVVAGLRRTYFVSVAAISPARLPSQRAGELLSRFSTDVAAVEVAATYTVASYLRDSLQIVVLLFVALAVNWRIALAALAVLPVAVIPAARLTRSVMKRLRTGQEKLGKMAADLQEALLGLRTIQAFNGQAAERRRFDEHARHHQRALIRAGWARGAVPGLMEVLAALAIASTLSFAVSRQLVPPAELISVLAALVLLYQPAKDLGRVTQFAVQAAVAGERLFAVLDVVSPVADAAGARPAPPLKEALELRDVAFQYGDRPALRGLSMRVPAGQVTALVGPSGSGKSTVASLLLRFERPARGALLLDGVDFEAFTADSLRAQFALVTQDALLFSAPVIDNLRLARPDATDDEVVAAARVAQADAFIRALPRGYATPIGERGVVLSGGQRQRLALARAVLARAPVLILDEATSNLDPASEQEVKAALAEVLRGRTALAIAHRLSTIQDADEIWVLDAGRAVEHGSHAALLAQGGAYARLWALQTEPGAEHAA